jgi:hypothetical protein
MSSTMAFDNSLPREETLAERPREASETSDQTWTEALTARDVEDKRFERSSRTPFVTHSVTLWDEITPVPCTQPDDVDDAQDR